MILNSPSYVSTIAVHDSTQSPQLRYSISSIYFCSVTDSHSKAQDHLLWSCDFFVYFVIVVAVSKVSGKILLAETIELATIKTHLYEKPQCMWRWIWQRCVRNTPKICCRNQRDGAAGIEKLLQCDAQQSCAYPSGVRISDRVVRQQHEEVVYVPNFGVNEGDG